MRLVRGGRAPLADLEGKVAAVTGAASGIGRALAVELNRRGVHLALSDVDKPGLVDTADRCAAGSTRVTTDAVDVADRAAVEAWAESVVADHSQVNLIVNNAGVALGGTVRDGDPDDVDWLMAINLWGVVHGTTAFLPHLEASGAGHVVNVSSVFGLVSIPTQSAYNASKFAVRGYTDALRMELELSGAPVSATTVHPGGIRTNIVRNARSAGEDRVGLSPAEFEQVARTTPQRAARGIVKAVTRNRRRILIGPDAWVLDGLARLPVGVTQRLVLHAARRRLHGQAG